MSPQQDTEALVTHIVEGLIDHPDSLKIERTETDKTLNFEITVHDEDIGKVIGRQGRIIRSIRVLARAAGMMDGKQVYVDVVG